MPRVALLIGVVLLLAACGGGGKSDADQVKQVWTTFFSSKTPVSEKPAMLQDGARFKSAIMSLSNNLLEAPLSAKVSKVTLEGNKARVIFSIYLANYAAFTNQVGYAYKQHGRWLVGWAGLCKLISKQPPFVPPDACWS